VRQASKAQCVAMEGSRDDTALETIELLESRLHRVQFLLTGDTVADGDVQRIAGAGKDQCVIARLRALEDALTSLSGTSRVAHDILHLCQMSFLRWCA